jgi:hypothetical protein
MTPHYFRSLAQDDFDQIKHTAYLKGLLRPFKGKGELDDWAIQCCALRDGLIDLAHTRIFSQARHYPFNLLNAQMTPHITGAGMTYLRWRNPERTTMGVALWQQCIENQATPNLLIGDLFALEQQRIALNMQISLTNTLARQARECAAKMGEAEVVYRRCLTQRGLAVENIG